LRGPIAHARGEVRDNLVLCTRRDACGAEAVLTSPDAAPASSCGTCPISRSIVGPTIMPKPIPDTISGATICHDVTAAP
jgi:hypothetical protein